MRVLIVDDEVPARRRMRRLLNAHPEVEVVGEAGDGEAALELAQRSSPDAMFLDLQMPGISGLEVAASLPEPAPSIVFVTAYDQYALAAFDAGAIDYVLKPVDPARLASAVQRLHTRFGAPRKPVSLAPARLLIPERGRTHVVAVAEVCWLESADNYVVVHAGARSLLMRRTLAGLLEDLGPRFIRTHRSAAVAISHVKAVVPKEKGDAEIMLSSGAVAPCSRSYRDALIKAVEHRPM